MGNKRFLCLLQLLQRKSKQQLPQEENVSLCHDEETEVLNDAEERKVKKKGLLTKKTEKVHKEEDEEEEGKLTKKKKKVNKEEDEEEEER